MEFPFNNYSCDQCGACCKSLIVEFYEIDVLRESRLLEIIPAEMLAKSEGGMLWDSTRKCCPYLSDQIGILHRIHGEGEQRTRTETPVHSCLIYPTRPTCCVAVQAGDAKCQQARKIQGLPMLRDRDGKYPDREGVLSDSADYYGLSEDEYWQEMSDGDCVSDCDL